jgi:hypothetical protein
VDYISDEEIIGNSIKDFEKVISDNEVSSALILPKVLGGVIQNHYKGESCLLSNTFEWTIDEVVTLEMKKLLPKILDYCDWLSSNGYDKTNPYTDFENAGYSAVMINDPDMVVLLNGTDDFSYIVKIDKKEHKFYVGNDKEPTNFMRYGIHIRLVECSADVEKEEYEMIPFGSLEWLSDKKEIKAKLFKFNDFRDEGYVVSSVQQPVSEDLWKTSSAYKNLNMLRHVNVDLLNKFYEQENS